MVEIRYLVTFSDGGVGMRTRSEPLEVGDELEHCGEHHTIVEVEQPPSEAGFGRARAEPDAIPNRSGMMPGDELREPGLGRTGRRRGSIS
jgi:hypothetical protein